MSAFRLSRISRSASAVLDRSLFTKKIPIAAARVYTPQNISKYLQILAQSREIVRLERLLRIRPDPDPAIAQKEGKCLLLLPQVKVEEPNTWSPVLREAVEKKEVGVIPYELVLDYNYWTQHDILEAILPEERHSEIPSGFTPVGHIAHLNLRDEYLPYRHLIAQVVADKNPKITTVINKIQPVGGNSAYRTFEYEVLLGDDNMIVDVREADCNFHFDYSKVYWNSRLQTEHTRLVDLIKPGEVLCDVMAGVGPFAVPAGKKGVHVWANDLNPDSYTFLKESIKNNKVNRFVHPFNSDGHHFIRTAADEVLSLYLNFQNKFTIQPPSSSRHPKRISRHPKYTVKAPPTPVVHIIPPTVSHFIMNLPASALSFLPSFTGLYHGREEFFEPHTNIKLPMVHVHSFVAKTDDKDVGISEVLRGVSENLGHVVKLEDEDVLVHEVRDVAPGKTMYCASFRLPGPVAFAERTVVG